MSQTQKTAPLVASTVDRPHIYVACLAAYNSGILHGAWVAADLGAAHIRERVRRMLCASPEEGAEEWAIHDYDGFSGVRIEEYSDFDAVCNVASFIEEHGELGAKLLEHFGGHLNDARAAFDDYAGEHESAAVFVGSLHDDLGTEIPDGLKNYIDWERIARDMILNGDIYTIEMRFDEVHIFWSR